MQNLFKIQKQHKTPAKQMSTPKQGFQDIRKITTLEKKSEPSDCHINWTQCQERFLCEVLLLKALQSQKDIKTIDWQQRGNRNHKRSIRQLPAGGGDTPVHGALRGASSGHGNRIGTEPLIKIIFIFRKRSWKYTFWHLNPFYKMLLLFVPA